MEDEQAESTPLIDSPADGYDPAGPGAGAEDDGNLLAELEAALAHLGRAITHLHAQERLPDWYGACEAGVVLTQIADSERRHSANAAPGGRRGTEQ